MFGVKRAFEQVVLLLVKPSYAAEAKLNVQYTQRRSREAQVLLANEESTAGLAYLSQQIQATQAVIERAPNNATRRELANQYITTLRTVSRELETGGPATAVNQPTRTPTRAGLPTATPTRPPTSPGQPTPTPAITPDPEEEIEEIQEEIEETIEELEDLSAQQPETAEDDDNDDGRDSDDDDDAPGNSDLHRQNENQGDDDQGGGNDDQRGNDESRGRNR